MYNRNEKRNKKEKEKEKGKKRKKGGIQWKPAVALLKNVVRYEDAATSRYDNHCS